MAPSKKALKREREKLWQMTSKAHGWKPIPVLMAELNRHLRGWANYFRFGYPVTPSIRSTDMSFSVWGDT